jgi:glycosyltransferase involved in cell wall biosynthesis
MARTRESEQSGLRIACIGARGIPASYGGIERVCEQLYAGLVERGHQVTMYCRSEYITGDDRECRGVVLRSAPAIRTKTLDTLTHTGCSLAHALTAGRYDLVHLHALAPNVFSSLCRLRGIPIVATVHGLDWQRAKWRGLGSKVLQFGERAMVAHADRIIVVSRALQEYFRSTYERETDYIPNGIDVRPPNAPIDETVLREYALRPGEYVLALGRLVPEKRVHDLIAAFRPLSGPLKLAITGDASQGGAYVQTLRSLAGDDPRVVFTGLQQYGAVRALFRHAAAWVNPSELEGLPTALLECIAEGTPPVVSDIPPHREVLVGAPGYDLFFVPGDVAGLQQALGRALAEREHYQGLTHQLREYAQSAYSWPAIIDRTERVFHDAVQRSIRNVRIVRPGIR